MKTGLPFLIILFLFLSCKSGQQHVGRRVPQLAPLDSLDTELTNVLHQSIMPGFAVSLIRNNKIVFSKGYGYADLKNNTPFTGKTINCVASISKTFIGLSIMQLVDAGKLDLDEPINSILPYKVINPFYPALPITVRHLVTHTSTLNQEFDPEDTGDATIFLTEPFEPAGDASEDFKKAIGYYKLGKKISLDDHIRNYTQPSGKWYMTENFLRHPPGAKFDYTNLDAVIAARIVEIKSGMTFEDYTKKYIFEPLHMNQTGWHDTDLNAALLTKIYMPDSNSKPSRAIEHPRYEMTDFPVGGLKTSMDDLSKYLIDMMKGYEGNGQLLRKKSYQILFSPLLPDSCFENRNDYPFNDQYSVGVFWAISASGYRLHNGGSIGVYSFIYFDPESGSGAVSFCNLPVADFGKVREVVHRYTKKTVR